MRADPAGDTRQDRPGGIDSRFDARLRDAWRQAREAHPGVAVGEAEFFERVRRAVAARGLEPGAALAALHTDDLYLVLGCCLPEESRARAARERFNERCLPVIRRIARKYLSAEDQFEDFVQDLVALLYLAGYRGAGRGSLLEQYGGTAPLEAWVATVATRRGLNRAQQLGRERDRFRPAVEPSGATGRSPSPALIQGLERAIRASVDALGEEDALALEYWIVDRLTQAEIGALVYGGKPSVPTVSRRLHAARASLKKSLLENIDRHVLERPDLPEVERDLDYVVAEVLPSLLDLGKALRKTS